jgi:hydrogenase nickel incorporation protein HypA/HybF
MHEHGVADHLMDQALEMARAQGLAKISGIKIGIGALTGLFPDPLRDALEHVAGHHGLTGIEYELVEIRPAAQCLQCGKNIGEEHQCPSCGDQGVKIIAGLDTVVLEVT